MSPIDSLLFLEATVGNGAPGNRTPHPHAGEEKTSKHGSQGNEKVRVIGRGTSYVYIQSHTHFTIIDFCGLTEPRSVYHIFINKNKSTTLSIRRNVSISINVSHTGMVQNTHTFSVKFNDFEHLECNSVITHHIICT